MTEAPKQAVAVAPPVQAPPVKQERKGHVNPTRFKPIAYISTHYNLAVEPNTTLEDILREDFWAHIAQQLKPFDEIRVVSDDGILYADVFVLTAGRAWAKVKVKYHTSLTSADVDQSQANRIDSHRVEYKGMHRKWSVIRTSDNEYLKDGFQTEDEAKAYLISHLKAL